MNIFEDLIDELKDENLLEATIVGKRPGKEDSASKENPAQEKAEKENGLTVEISEADVIAENAANVAAAAAAAAKKHSEMEFYRKRAKDEVAFLQIVEYVFAGVEREQLKTVPKPYNDIQVRKLLHSFLQITADPQTPAHGTAQFQLLQETESWHSSLSLRDANVLTAHLRRFCETSRPPLGSPALISLARFYRNSTYSEPVRSKFDLVVTRLFSKETDGNRRETLYDGAETSRRLTKLYADWSSASLYPTEAKNPKTLEIVEKFADFVREADAAGAFDELIDSNFFGRLYKFKESVNENFFAPTVTAAAVESNVRIGNRYVELLNDEKTKGSVAEYGSKYGFSHDQTVSEATGKTLALAELLNQKAAAPPIEVPTVVKSELPPSRKKTELLTAKQPSAAAVAPTAAEAPQFDKRLVLLAASVVLFVAVIYLVVG